MTREQLISEIGILFAAQGYQMPDVWVETLSDADLLQVFDQLREQVYVADVCYQVE